ncbi:MAG: hypothetical protein LH468_13700 [Nocardioides sp.]|nr:hypothetical protein [Nocardioides sp.]
MAGGMGGGWNSRRGSGIPLEQRVRVGAEQPARARGEGAERCPARHCWVADAIDSRSVRRPGLLVEWRRQDGRWQGRVVYAAQLRADGWALVEEWVPSELLTVAG